ncbi:hypothetical protein EYZ11_009384 [Aspergillus tanneri]|uniref:Uncharacterized protein n=1 Tax=Aspergillus tanneri TaxID=1220188 RepID=A0A4S3J809_9EURO|nr:uncharacterized protein ATNIH1004_002398 [Aspergillus tanneri]KAA8649724.1 hypothetical protein ATNIH1004_002398 [Aspergillus tanneri]THC91153.1 hypothetical protein EYZ11_009384 [Aspergillus tanneri]
MFEDFSFSSPSSTRPSHLAGDGDDRLMVDCDSTLISPLSSRCPSPRSSTSQRFPRRSTRSRSSYFRSHQAPTSVPLSAYDHKRLSIATLTRKLHEHTIQNSSRDDTQLESPTSPTADLGSVRFPGYVLTPPDTDHDDEGFFDSSSLTSPSLSPQPQSPFLSPTSVPLDHQAEGGTPDFSFPDSWNVRVQRQHISRLQCNPSDIEAIRQALLSEDDALNINLDLESGEDDCHPSSLPPQKSPRRNAVTRQRSRFQPQNSASSLMEPAAIESRGRRKSSSGVVQSYRIEKNYPSLTGRDMRKSEQGLRRKSLVSAALASLVEKRPCTPE